MDHQDGLDAAADPALDASPEILSPASDDDLQAEPDQDKDPESEDAPDDGVSTDDLEAKIIRQVEYYFSDQNLPTDKHMSCLIKKNKQGFDDNVAIPAHHVTFYSYKEMITFLVSENEFDDLKQGTIISSLTLSLRGLANLAVLISVISSFKKMKKLTRDISLVVAALRESSLLVVSPDEKKVKRRNPFIFTEARDPKFCTVVVENLPADYSVENIRRLFGELGSIKNISIRDPQVQEELKKGCETETQISHKLHAIVEYQTIDSAEKAVAILNDTQDWRNGMRVKLLKQLGKYVQRRQARRDADKDNNGHVTDRNTDDDHTCDIAEEEEKNCHKDKGRGKPRRQKHRGMIGLGHGAALSPYLSEASKPPPGPKMPDGTRGFTMGRGQPLASTHMTVL